MPEITFVLRISSWNFLRIGHTYQNTTTIALLENKKKQNTKQNKSKTKQKEQKNSKNIKQQKQRPSHTDTSGQSIFWWTPDRISLFRLIGLACEHKINLMIYHIQSKLFTRHQQSSLVILLGIIKQEYI